MDSKSDNEVLRISVLVLPLLFFVGSYFVFAWRDFNQLSRFVEEQAGATVRQKAESLFEWQRQTQPQNTDVAQQVLLLLEADALNKHHKQSSIVLLSRIHTRQSASFAGMLLVFIGSVFIIGKLREPINKGRGGY